MADNWNKAGFFSGITEDYSNYHWYKGEKENPYKSDTFHPLAATFWEYVPGKSPNPEGDTTNWEKSFETGKREV